MKRSAYLLLLSFFYLVTALSVQSQKEAATGTMKYLQITAFNDTTKKFSIPFSLQFNQVESLSIKTGEIHRLNSSDSATIFVRPADKPFYVYVNRQSKRMVSRQQADLKKVIVDDSLQPISWTIMKQTRRIGNMLCQRAEADTRGRHFIAWFTTEIPVGAGPWKLYGLPGLILDAADMSGEVRFVFESVIIPSSANISIGPPILAVSEKTMTEKECFRLHWKLSDNFNKMLNSRPDSEGRNEKVEVKHIEIYPRQ